MSAIEFIRAQLGRASGRRLTCLTRLSTISPVLKVLIDRSGCIYAAGTAAVTVPVKIAGTVRIAWRDRLDPVGPRPRSLLLGPPLAMDRGAGHRFAQRGGLAAGKKAANRGGFRYRLLLPFQANPNLSKREQ
jgi:hypothetical protein